MKSIPNQTGLYRTHSSYYFRKKIPLDLREILDSRECKKAFRQPDYLSAKRTTACLNAALDQLFAMIRLMQPTSDDIKLLIRTYFEKLLMDAEGLLWLDSEVWRGYETENHDGATPDERIRQREEALAHIQNTAKMQGQHELFRDQAKQLMEWKGYTFSEMSPAANQLYRGLLDAELEARRIDLAVRNGETANAIIHHPLFKDCRNFLLDPDIDLLIENEGRIYYEQKQDSPTLPEAVKRHIDFIRHKEYAGNTLQDIENTLMLMAEIMGETKRLSAITNEDCRKFRDIVLKMPSNYGKKYKPKGMSVLDVIDSGAAYAMLSPNSQHKYWQWTKAFFTWSVEEGYIKEDPVGRIKVQPSKATIEDRDPFSDEELQAFFLSPQYTGHKSESRRSEKGDQLHKDGKYWIPLLGLFTGMRMGEIRQNRSKPSANPCTPRTDKDGFPCYG
jgi:hypothetical protein